MSILDIFANISKDEEIFPLTVSEIAQEQHVHWSTKVYFSQGNTTRRKKTTKTDKRISLKIIDNTKVLVYDNYRLVIPGTDLQSRAVQWYHHYLQHPGHSQLEETLSAVMWWPNMRGHIQAHIKRCKHCQLGKKCTRKYGHLPPKIAKTTPWQCVCCDLIGPYTLKGKDGSILDFMCLTMIDPATGWFEIIELPNTSVTYV